MGNISNWINQHGMLVAPMAVVVLVIAWLVTLMGGGEDMSRYTYRYYYDLDTGEIIVDDGAKVPPIRSALGGEAVLAVMIGCGSCEDRGDMKIGWLEKYTDQAKQMLRVGPGGPPGDMSRQEVDQAAAFNEVMARDHLLALPPEPGQQPQWVSGGFPEGEYVRTAARRKCGGGATRARVCAVTEADLP